MNLTRTSDIIGPMKAVWDKADPGVIVPAGILSRAHDFVARAIARQFQAREERERHLRISSIDHCAAQQAFGYYGYPTNGRGMNLSGRLTFLVGDLSEVSMVVAALAAGVPLAFALDEQLSVSVTVGGEVILGHPDCLLIGRDGPRIVEFKSMPDWRWEKLVNGRHAEDPFLVQYLGQANAYCVAAESMLQEKVGGGYIVALKKSTGELCEVSFDFDAVMFGQTTSRARRVLGLAQHAPPGIPPGVDLVRGLREYFPGEGGRLPAPCNYCAYKRTCWDDHEVVEAGQYMRVFPKKEEHVSPR